MYLYYIFVAVLAFALSFASLYAVSKLNSGKYRLTQKIFSLVLFGLFFLRYMLAEDAVADTVGLNISSPFGAEGQTATLFSVVLLWLNFAALTALILYPFFKDRIKTYPLVMKLFVMPVYLFSIVFIGYIARVMDGEQALSSFNFRSAVYAAEAGFAFGMCAKFLLEKMSVSYGYGDYGRATLVSLGMAVSAIPAYLFQVVFGRGSDAVKIYDLAFYHRLLIYGAFILPVAVFFIFRKRDYFQKRFALLYISLTAMHTFSYNYSFSVFANVTSLPLHLCNTAMYIIPLCLIFKWDKLFYFTLFVNVFGAFTAMLMPNYSADINYLSGEAVKFWANHYCAFFMPLLMVALGIYKRPDFKQFINSMIAFSVYFLAILIINAWFSNYGSVDYFFINSDYVADKLGKWAKDLMNIVISFNIGELKFVFYPLYQFLFFLTYVGISFAMWFVYAHFFRLADTYYEIGRRFKKIKADSLALEVQLAGRSQSEPMFPENENKLVLKNFSKKYASSDVYAVKDASLEISGGQIFGFLGPNGAGKSTIIKSIVGIQTITSGSIEVCGYDVEKQSVYAKMQTGFVPDHYALYENLTGREYVNYIADLYGVSKEDRTARIDEYVKNFNLEKAFDNQIKTYSHGMKQKITIMSALVHNPKLWILDEPLTGLDPESIFQVKECMKKHAKAGNIVFFSSHIIDVVERICDRIAIIKSGKILCECGVKELEERGEQLENFYMEMIGEKRND